MRKDYMIMMGTVVVSFAIGAAGGYIFAQKRLEDAYSNRSEKEIEEAKQYYKRMYKKDEFASPEQVVEFKEDLNKVVGNIKEQIKKEAEEALESYSGKKKEEKQSQNVFVDNAVDEEEVKYDPFKNRDTSKPYILTYDEFFDNIDDNNQSHLTYFEGDDVLVDEHDDPIPDIDQTVGEDNLIHFGLGSDDPDVLYIRNEKSGLDFEVHRSTGSYTREVLGFDDSMDERPKIRKFRGDDE